MVVCVVGYLVISKVRAVTMAVYLSIGCMSIVLACVVGHIVGRVKTTTGAGVVT